jgi:hypothetical protein
MLVVIGAAVSQIVSLVTRPRHTVEIVEIPRERSLSGPEIRTVEVSHGCAASWYQRCSGTFRHEIPSAFEYCSHEVVERVQNGMANWRLLAVDRSSVSTAVWARGRFLFTPRQEAFVSIKILIHTIRTDSSKRQQYACH